MHLRTQLTEAAMAYRKRANVGTELRKRQAGAPAETVARAWKAQVHLTAKFRRLAVKKPSINIATTAIARELAGFLWAEMVA